MKNLVIKSLLLLALQIVLTTTLRAADYHVGPGQPYTNINDVPWESMSAGDNVFIHWRSTPYKEKWVINVQGTSTQPFTVSGVLGPNGERPVIDGNGATTRAQLSYWNEMRGLIKVGGSVVPADGMPSYIVIENLELRSAYVDYTFTNASGNQQNYSNNAGALYIEKVNNLIVRNCAIHDSGNGIISSWESFDILVEKSHIYGNGVVGRSREHNVYTEAINVTYQYNRFGPLRDGASGTNIKDRSAGLVIRYNWIENGSRILDCVETEQGAEFGTIFQQPNYHDVYVYGNMIINDVSKNGFSSNMIHYGFDNSPEEGKIGTLYFYNNTVHITNAANVPGWWATRLFDLPLAASSVDMYNNVINEESLQDFYLMRDAGTLTFYANNWLDQTYKELGWGATAQVVYSTAPITGTDPDFTNVSIEDFTLTSVSPAVDQSGSLPSHIVTSYPLNQEYVLHADVKSRPVQGNAMDLGAFESGNTGNPAPSVPENLLSTAQTSSTISLSWDVSTGTVTGYKVYRGGVEVASVSGTTYTDTGLTSSTTYSYTVSALNGGSESAQSAALSVSTSAALAPSVPENLLSTGQTSSTISLSWDASTGTVTGYKVYREGTEVATVSGTTYTDTGLISSTTYSYTVSALNGGSESAQSTALSVSTTSAPAPSVPENLLSTGQTSSTISLSWDASAGTVTGYKVYREGAEVATVSGTTYTDTGLTPSTTYSYTVSALNGGSESAQSTALSASTTEPGGGNDPVFGSLNPAVSNILEVLPAPGSVDVNVTELKIKFAAGYSNEWSAGEYINLYRTADNTLIEAVDIGSLPIVIYTEDIMTVPLSQTLEAGTTYYVTVNEGSIYVNQGPSWKNGAITVGAWSFAVGSGSNPAPSIPTGLAETSSSSTTISLSWDASTGTVTGYKVYRGGVEVSSVSGTTYTDTGLTPSTTYSYTVSALNGSNESAQSAVENASTTLVPSPAGLTSTAQTSTTVSLTWAGITEPVTSYKVYRGGVEVASVSGTTYTDTGLTPSTTYSYTVSALNGSNESAQSAALSVSTTSGGNTAPVFGLLNPAVVNILEVLPAPGSVDVTVTELKIKFAAEYGTEWYYGEYINVYRASDNVLIESIDVGSLPVATYTDSVMTIVLTQSLAANTEYYVTANESFAGVNLGPSWSAGAITTGVWNFITSSSQGSSSRKLSGQRIETLAEERLEVGVWPNPFSNQLRISTLGEKGSKVTFVLFDALGQQQFAQAFVLQRDNEVIEMDRWVAELPVGIYHLQAIAEKSNRKTIVLIKK